MIFFFLIHRHGKKTQSKYKQPSNPLKINILNCPCWCKTQNNWTLEISNTMLWSPPIKVKSEIQGFWKENCLLVTWQLQEQIPHPYVEQSQFTLSSSHRSLICPWPQPHRGAVLRSFAEDINKPKSLSRKIITIAVFNDKLFLKIILLFTFYGKVCGKRQYHFFPAILEWASLSGPDALTLAKMCVPSHWGDLIFEVSTRSSPNLKNHGEYTGTVLFSPAS